MVLVLKCELNMTMTVTSSYGFYFARFAYAYTFKVTYLAREVAQYVERVPSPLPTFLISLALIIISNASHFPWGTSSPRALADGGLC